MDPTTTPTGGSSHMMVVTVDNPILQTPAIVGSSSGPSSSSSSSSSALNSASTAPIFMLPNRLLARIFSYLNQNKKNELHVAILVCKRFLEVALTTPQKCWSTLKISKRQNPDILKLLRHLTLPRFYHLKSFNLWYIDIDNSLFEAIANPKKYPSLTNSLVPSVIAARKVAFPRLETFTAYNTNGFTEIGFELFLSSVGNTLVDIKIDSCKPVTDDMVMLIAKHCPNLMHLELSQCEFITDRAIGCLAMDVSSKSLQRILLQHCLLLTDTAIEYICAGIPNLRLLHLKNIPLLTDASCDFIATLSNLEWLVLKRVAYTDVGLSRLVMGECLRKLKLLDISFNPVVTGQSLVNIAQTFGCLELVVLRMYHIDIDDPAMEILSEVCPKLIVLALDCDKLTMNALQSLSKNCPNIRSLALPYRLTEEAGIDETTLKQYFFNYGAEDVVWPSIFDGSEFFLI
eukprot:TRINITY_DN3604_c0_g1_i1.p1 TRINITY_DN3604_c0_g1~~TRINITY_DN3604_c0_g1_i1.p1  ORF type:complete len:476 (-),score=93.30 TRINITY_DN3604_c0_g1_i1:46-1419(-)